MNSLEMFITSPHYCYNKCIGTRKEKLYFDFRVLRVNRNDSLGGPDDWP